MNKPPEEIVASAPEGTVWFGGPVDRSTMSLRIFGESVDPLEITKLLGHEPTKGRKKETDLLEDMYSKRDRGHCPRLNRSVQISIIRSTGSLVD